MTELDIGHNNPLNNSTSKQQYSFSALERFKQRVKTQGADVFYDIPSTKDQKTFSFGKFKRQHQFNNIKPSPPPGQYCLQGDFQKTIKKKQGIKILYSRDQCKSNNIFQVLDIPGPGAYNPNPEYAESKISRQMTLGRATMSQRLNSEETPGPGTYEMSSTILNQNKVLSKEKKKVFGKVIFPQSKTKRVKTERNPQLRFPQITSKGQKLIKPDKGYTIGKSPRFALKKLTEMPGPGAYNKFSQFIQSSKKKW